MKQQSKIQPTRAQMTIHCTNVSLEVCKAQKQVSSPTCRDQTEIMLSGSRGQQVQLALKGQFPTPSQAITFFNLQNIGARRVELGLVTLKQTLLGEFVTLDDIRNTYSENDALNLLKIYLVSFCELSNLTILTDAQTETCSRLLYEDLRTERITTVHEFFKRLLKAHYGNFYGAIQVTLLMSYCTAFIKDVRRLCREVTHEDEKMKRDMKFEEASRYHRAAYPHLYQDNKTVK